MKRILAAVLTLCMLCTLLPSAALAEEAFEEPDAGLEELLPEEFLMELPAEEEAFSVDPAEELLTEELFEFPEDMEEMPLPLTMEEEEKLEARDVSGTVYASSLSENEALTLIGNTILVMDADRTLKSVSGSFGLTIQGSKTLTVDSGGNGITVNTLTISGAFVFVTGKKIGLDITNGITMNSGILSADGGKDGIRIRNGSFTIHAGIIEAYSGTNCAAVSLDHGGITMEKGTLNVGGAKYGIYAPEGTVSLNGTLKIAAAGWAIWAGSILIQGGSAVVKSDGHAMVACTGSITINSDVEAESTGSGASTLAAVRDVVINSGTVSAISHGNGAAIRTEYGSVKINGGSVTANGSEYGIYAPEGSVTIKAPLTTAAVGWAIWAGSLAVDGGKVTAKSNGNAITASSGSITISGDIEAESYGSNTAAIAAARDITVNSGRVSAAGAQYGIYTAGGSVTLNGNISASASGWGVWGESAITFSGGKATLSGGVYAAYSPTTISLIPPMSVLSPAGGYAAANAFADQNGNAATYVVIGAYTVTFNNLGHGNTPSAQTVARGKTAKEPAAPTAVGMKFEGWYTNSACTVKYSFSTPVTADITLYAKWTAEPLSGTVKINGTVKHYGDTLEAALSGTVGYLSASIVHFQWQVSSDKKSWTDVTGAVKSSYKTPEGETVAKYYRVAVTADGHAGTLYSDVRAVNPRNLTPLTGSVVIEPAYGSRITPGVPVNAVLKDVNVHSRQYIQYRWQKSADRTSWQYITGAETSSYTPLPEDASLYIRVEISYHEYYTGELYSTGRLVESSGTGLVVGYVNRCYQEILGRDGEPEGIAFWTNALSTHQAAGADIVASFCDSPEFIAGSYSEEHIIWKLYAAMMGREPDDEGLKHWKYMMEDLGCSGRLVMQQFSASAEFKNICDIYGIIPGTVSLETRDLNPLLTGFVSRCYRITMKRYGDPGGLNYWAGQLLNRTQTPHQVAMNFLHSEEFLKRDLDIEDYVIVLYRLYMGEDREIDEEGFRYWTDQLFYHTLTRDDVANSFAASPEFQAIVESYGL